MATTVEILINSLTTYIKLKRSSWFNSVGKNVNHFQKKILPVIFVLTAFYNTHQIEALWFLFPVLLVLRTSIWKILACIFMLSQWIRRHLNSESHACIGMYVQEWVHAAFTHPGLKSEMWINGWSCKNKRLHMTCICIFNQHSINISILGEPKQAPHYSMVYRKRDWAWQTGYAMSLCPDFESGSEQKLALVFRTLSTVMHPSSGNFGFMNY